jgi:hypothetical protein
MINEREIVGGTRICRRMWSTQRNPVPVSLFQPHIPHDLTWARTQATTVGNRQLTAWAIVYRPIYGSTVLMDLGRFFSLLIYTQSVGLLGWGISPSKGRYLHTEQHRHRINAHRNIHASSGIRTYDPSVRVSEDDLCLRPRGHCNRSLSHGAS